MTIWMDLTNSLTQHKGNVVGIVRSELMQAKLLHEIDPSIKFSVLTQYGFQEVKKADLKWLFNSKNINADYLKYQEDKKKFLARLSEKIKKKIDNKLFKMKRRHRDKIIPKNEFIIYPYKDSDLVYSCGWLGTEKEDFFSRIKNYLPNLKLVYTIYDLVMVKDNLRHLYYPQDVLFDQYMYWISKNCSAIIYGGRTAQKDAEKYFAKYNLQINKGYFVKWGNEISSSFNETNILKKLKINSPYILAVGSVDFKKNYEVLYRAYCIMKRKKIQNLPELIIVGRTIGSYHEFVEMVKNNPLTKDCIKFIQCSDDELKELYKNCLFTVLPTLYEGWSLTLPESFYFGKLCVCSDVEPLREVGENYACYIDPTHPQDWADKIEYFISNQDELKKIENKIHKTWKSISWKEATQSVYNNLIDVIKTDATEENNPILYYDISLFWFNGGLSGIPRTQMLLARNLYKYNKNIKYFWMNKGKYNELSKEQLSNLLSSQELDIAVKLDKQKVRNIIKKDILPFKKHDIVFSAGVGYDQKSYNALLEAHEKNEFIYCQVIYDFTPVTVPHTHPQERVQSYPKFLNDIYNLSDFIFYGGKTAQIDGIEYQNGNGLNVKKSFALKWGSDIVSHKYTKKEKEAVLKKYGINDNFILTVGTIEARKNHETLYRAYLELLKDESLKDKLPQLIICGHPGWKTDSFRHMLNVDTRIFGKVIQITPTDEELDILYQTCMFTCLASFYEGWSLTLPESLNYGKFCLASDTPSLVETGEDIIDYADPYDPQDWAQKIKFYATNKTALKQREALIKKKWHNTTWQECAEHINNELKKLTEK